MPLKYILAVGSLHAIMLRLLRVGFAEYLEPYIVFGTGGGVRSFDVPSAVSKLGIHFFT